MIPFKIVRSISSSTAIIYGCASVMLISRTFYVTVKVNKRSKGTHQMVGYYQYFIGKWITKLVHRRSEYLSGNLQQASEAHLVWMNLSRISSLAFPYIRPAIRSWVVNLLRTISSLISVITWVSRSRVLLVPVCPTNFGGTTFFTYLYFGQPLAKLVIVESERFARIRHLRNKSQRDLRLRVKVYC